MGDREKVIKGLECCDYCYSATNTCFKCPYIDINRVEGMGGCTAELAHDALALLKELEAVGGWISVKDRLPETGRLALVYGSAGAMTVARYIANNEWLVPGIFSTVTHWMPLPEPPTD